MPSTFKGPDMLIDTEEKYEYARVQLSEEKRLWVDTETEGLNGHQGDRVCGYVIGTQSRGEFYFPVRHKEGRNLPLGYARDICTNILTPDRVQTFHNAVFDLNMMRPDGYVYPDRFYCTQLGAHLMNENERSWKLENLASRILGVEFGSEEEELIDYLVERFGGSRKNAKGHMHKVDAQRVWEYGCADVRTTRLLEERVVKGLEVWGLRDLFDEIMEFQRVMAEAMYMGIGLDLPLMTELDNEAIGEAEKALLHLQNLAGFEINPRSAKQLQKWFGMPSTAAPKLAPLVEQGDPRAIALLDYRKWHKVHANYFRKFREVMSPKGTIHAGFKLWGTATGRLSCSNPPLQAIPTDANDILAGPKKVFKAREGFLIAEFDYRQAEIVVMAHETRDPVLVEVAESGRSMHDATRDATGLERDIAKRLNFSAQYGVGVAKFAATYGFTVAQATEYLNKYHSSIPGVRRLYNDMDRIARRQGFIRLYTGRVRHYEIPRSPPHKASSNLVQGNVGEMLRIAQTRLAREVPEFRQLVPVHDSVVGEIPVANYREICSEVQRIMTDQPWLSVPIRVEAKVGTHWGLTKEVK